MGRPSAPRGGRTSRMKGPGFSKMVEDASDTEDDRIAASAGELKEANISMTAREIIDSCRGECNNLAASSGFTMPSLDAFTPVEIKSLNNFWNVQVPSGFKDCVTSTSCRCR